MKMRYVAVLVALTTVWTGCDFNAAEEAFDNFDVIIELEPINTVLNGIIVDHASDQLLTARLTFSGSGAGALIDAYSDPISSLDADGGLVTFGIDNGVVPTDGAPFELTVTAEADGYFTTSESIAVTSLGEGQFTIRMSSNNIASSVAGTSSTQDNSVSADAGGAVAQTVTVQTQPTGQTTAAASVTVPQGSVPLTAAGTRLSGQITTQIRSYDSGSGLKALPSRARQRTDGTNQAVGGAVFFKMTDASGNVAVGAQGASSGKGAGTCTGGIVITITSTDPALRAAFDAATALGATVPVTVWAYTPADGLNAQVATANVEADGPTGVKVELCLGGTGGGDTGVINTSAIGNAADGMIYTIAFAPSETTAGSLSHVVNVTGITGGVKNVVTTLTGPGLNVSATVGINNGSHTVASLVNAGGTFDIVNNATYVLSMHYLGSTETVTASMASPLTGSSSVAMPTSSGLETFNVTASLSCDNPVTHKFEVLITSESLDAVSAFYRETAGGSWTLLPGDAVSSKTATDATIEIVGSLDLKPSTPYDFKGVLGTDSSVTTETTPAAGGAWTITLSTSDVGIDCVAR